MVNGKINLASGSSAAFKKSASFKIHMGLGGGMGISFESVAMPGYYITESKYRLIVSKVVNSDSWKQSATWRFVQAQVTTETVTHHSKFTLIYESNDKFHN